MEKTLTEKGKFALAMIKEYFPKGQFTCKMLSDACGEKIAAATLTSVVNHGYLIQFDSTPKSYEAVDGLDELIEVSKSSKGCDNSSLLNAKKVKDDEFYTRFEDIEAEVSRYAQYFKDKIVYLPCDDPADDKNTEFKRSEYWTFFMLHFNDYGLKRLIATHYEDDHSQAYKIWVDRKPDGSYITDDDVLQEELAGTGDFRSAECLEILDESDIVCTNPPFSLFREFVDTLVRHNKQFLIIGNENGFTTKETFHLIRDNKMWIGYNKVKKFLRPDGSVQTFGNVCWYTNLPTVKLTEPLILTQSYAEKSYDYPKYDNYDAINVSRVVDIPKDYDGVMGVPVSFIEKYCPEQFRIIGVSASWDETDEMKKIKTSPKKRHGPFINGKEKYKRLFIQKR